MSATTERMSLAEDAAIEVESIALVLQTRFQTVDSESGFLRGLAIRLEALSGVVLDACNGRPLDEARATLEGSAATRLRREAAQ